jgi:hypothetical protein
MMHGLSRDPCGFAAEGTLSFKPQTLTMSASSEAYQETVDALDFHKPETTAVAQCEQSLPDSAEDPNTGEPRKEREVTFVTKSDGASMKDMLKEATGRGAIIRWRTLFRKLDSLDKVDDYLRNFWDEDSGTYKVEFHIAEETSDHFQKYGHFEDRNSRSGKSKSAAEKVSDALNKGGVQAVSQLIPELSSKELEEVQAMLSAMGLELEE